MSLSAFLAENATAVENVKYVVSKRFVGEDGQPVAWEIKAISGSEDEALRRACVKRALVPGRRNQYQRETDYDMYMGKLAAAEPEESGVAGQLPGGGRGGFAENNAHARRVCGIFGQGAGDLRL